MSRASELSQVHLEAMARERERSRELQRSRDASSHSQIKSNGMSYSPLRPQNAAISPNLGLDSSQNEGPSRIQHLNASSSYEYQPRPRASPLRSPYKGPSPQRVNPGIIDNQERMRKSQERIAAILGIGAGPKAPGVVGRPGIQNQSIQELLNSRRAEYRAGSREPTEYIKVGGGSPLRDKSRSRSPQRYPGSAAVDPGRVPYHADGGQNPQFASTMVKQSLADLKDRLDLMRREKQ